MPPGTEPLEDGEVGRSLAQLQVSVDPGLGITFSGPSLCAAIANNGKVEFPKNFMLQDLLRVRSDGSLVYEGRAKFVLNRGGRKMSLECLESEIANHFGIESLCLSIPHARLGEELGLLLKIPSEELRARREVIFDHLRKHYGANFSSDFVRAVPSFPCNVNLKPDRQKAAALFANPSP